MALVPTQKNFMDATMDVGFGALSGAGILAVQDFASQMGGDKAAMWVTVGGIAAAVGTGAVLDGFRGRAIPTIMGYNLGSQLYASVRGLLG